VTGILTPGERTSVWGTIGDLMRRVARLEAVPPDQARMVYGRLLEDGDTLDGGSGDWSAVWDVVNNWITITISPAFTSAFAFTATPNDSGNVYATAPALGPAPVAESGFMKSIQESLSIVHVVMWDLDGNFAIDNNFGFDFVAVGQ
jgi:hypothetical protein